MNLNVEVTRLSISAAGTTMSEEVTEALEKIQAVRRVEVCSRCDGENVQTSDVGGIAFGGCPTCDGTGLIVK